MLVKTNITLPSSPLFPNYPNIHLRVPMGIIKFFDRFSFIIKSEGKFTLSVMKAFLVNYIKKYYNISKDKSNVLSKGNSYE